MEGSRWTFCPLQPFGHQMEGPSLLPLQDLTSHLCEFLGLVVTAPQAGWLKTAEMYHLAVLGAGSPKAKRQQGGFHALKGLCARQRETPVLNVATLWPRQSRGCLFSALRRRHCALVRVLSLGREDALEKEMSMHSSILPWKMAWTEEPVGLQSMGSQKSLT